MENKFREMLREGKPIVMPGSHDPISAKVVDWAGFDAVYMSGAGASAAVLAAPDLGFMTLTEMVRQARNIVNTVNIPVISDADTGYGDALNVTRTIKEFEKAGVAGVHLEDLEKHQCGLHMDKKLLTVDEMMGRIKAAKDACASDDFVVIARTDAIGADDGGIEEAIKRANLYVEAGADAIWVQEPPVAFQTDDMFETINRSISAPLMGAAGYNQHSIKQFEDWGYKIIFYPTLSIQVVIKALMDLAKDIKEQGYDKEFCAELPKRGVSFEEFMNFTEFYNNQKIREKYS